MPLGDQDWTRWTQARIDEGAAAVEAALRAGGAAAGPVSAAGGDRGGG